MLGIATGIVASSRMSASMGWRTALDSSSILLAFVFSSVIGIVFGVWPALRASRLDPVEALRFE